jgi:RNA polymerase sigma-70 factor, ECF subfamily
MPRSPLAAALLSGMSSAAVPDHAEQNSAADRPDLEALLEAAIAECRATWPAIHIDALAFCSYVGQRLPRDGDVKAALAAASLSDLYLAYGCVLGDPAAVSALDSELIRRIVLLPFGSVPKVRDAEELAQRLRVRVLVGDAEQPPRIASYTGRGPLNAWLRVAAARLAVDLHRAETNPAPVNWSMLTGPIDQELLYLKQTHADLFGTALDGALGALSKRARTVLRLHFLEGVPVTQLATSYAVSPRSVQRWIVNAQTEVIDQIRATLGTSLELTGSQLESLIGAMQTELVIALRDFFQTRDKNGNG